MAAHFNMDTMTAFYLGLFVGSIFVGILALGANWLFPDYDDGYQDGYEDGAEDVFADSVASPMKAVLDAPIDLAELCSDIEAEISAQGIENHTLQMVEKYLSDRKAALDLGD